jgi:hypothetical protein
MPRTAAMMDAATLDEYKLQARARQIVQDQNDEARRQSGMSGNNNNATNQRVPFDSEKFKADTLQQLEFIEEEVRGESEAFYFRCCAFCFYSFFFFFEMCVISIWMDFLTRRTKLSAIACGGRWTLSVSLARASHAPTQTRTRSIGS